MGKTSKVVVMGHRGCGKTSILEQLIYGNSSAVSQISSRETYPTIEDVYVAMVETDRGTREKMRFYDTAGLELNCREVPRHYLSFADAFVLVYGINDNDSFMMLDGIKKDVERNKEKKEVAVVVLGNKSDLTTERQVDTTVTQAWSNREKVKVFEVSALDRKTLAEPFVYLCSKLNPPPSKSSFPPLVRKPKLIGTSDN